MRLIAGLFRLVFRLILLPFKLLIALLGTSLHVLAGTFRVGFKVGTAPVKVGARATRIAGFSGRGRHLGGRGFWAVNCHLSLVIGLPSRDTSDKRKSPGAIHRLSDSPSASRPVYGCGCSTCG